MNDETNNGVRIWDLPLRLFHWSLVGLTGFSIFSGHVGELTLMEYHKLSGYAVLALIVFRIAWGFAGSHYSRFNAFEWAGLLPDLRSMFKRPLLLRKQGVHKQEVRKQEVRKQEVRGQGDQGQAVGRAGHNPAGSISIVLMLLLLLVQTVTGLFSHDDIMLEGPLTHLVSEDTSELLTSIHHINKSVLYVFLGLHLLAVAFHELLKRERLLLPMITGRKQLAGDYPAPAPTKEIATALVILAVITGAVWYLVNLP